MCTGATPVTAADLARLPEWTLTEEWRIGSRNTPGEILTTPLVFAIDEGAGHFLLGQPLTGEIARYDREGRRVQLFGRLGDGPGEFRSIDWIGLRGDTIHVSDFRARRLNLFTPAGGFIASRQVWNPSGDPSSPLPPFGVLDDGTLVVSVPVPFDRRPGAERPQIPMLLMDVDGTVLDTLMMGRSRRIPVTVGSLNFSLPALVADDPLFVMSHRGDRVTVLDRSMPEGSGADSGCVQITTRAVQGEVLLDHAYVYRAIAFDESRTEAAVRQALAVAGQLLQDPGPAETVIREALVPPAFESPILGLLPGSARTLWIHLLTPGRPDQWWIVLSDEGRGLARVRVPDEVELRVVGEGMAWGLARDELDVPYVVAYVIQAQ